ncbi:quinon protein alcohol dehydrogenase-like superfamily [Amylostereum chailletii]|nr:quinon protein alcohol dehydrogenase-like superfamily [Amylostereum chailletii]
MRVLSDPRSPFLLRSMAASSSTVAARASAQQTEELVYSLLSSLPRSSLSRIQRRIVPLLHLDVVGLLPTEVALLIFSYLPWKSLLHCCLVSKRWNDLANDATLWKRLCASKSYQWNVPSPVHPKSPSLDSFHSDTDDEGMGDEEDDMTVLDPSNTIIPDDSGFASMNMSTDSLALDGNTPPSTLSAPRSRHFDRSFPDIDTNQPFSPSAASPQFPPRHLIPNYKLLYLTHTRLHHRFLSGSYHLSYLQTRGAANSHTNTIYCLQLYTYPDTGTQVLFTGSKDRTIKEWDVKTGEVLRVIQGVHEGSVLSVCVHGGYLASAGSDGRTVLYNLTEDRVVKVVEDHDDSVLCVRFNGNFLVSCSKDRTVRTYRMPNLARHRVLTGHRAAVNAISISSNHVISASGDRSIRIWNVETGALERTFENHHGRGIASIDIAYPLVLSGSSDKHIRVFDVTTTQGWSTSSEFDTRATVPLSSLAIPISDDDASADGMPLTMCQNCGGAVAVKDTTGGSPHAVETGRMSRQQCGHADLVRSVAMGTDFVVSGSYDLGVKVWDRKSGRLVADLAGGHTGRIFCVGFDATKVVSCGEDQKICIWDFASHMDTSFITL